MKIQEAQMNLALCTRNGLLFREYRRGAEIKQEEGF